MLNEVNTPLDITQKDFNVYWYVRNNPANTGDPQAFGVTPCNSVGLTTAARFWCTPQHNCHHTYIHCMSCCLIARQIGDDCATSWQTVEDAARGHQGKGMQFCMMGISVKNKPGSCSDKCLHLLPWPKPAKCCCLPNCDARQVKGSMCNSSFDCCTFLQHPNPAY